MAKKITVINEPEPRQPRRPKPKKVIKIPVRYDSGEFYESK